MSRKIYSYKVAYRNKIGDHFKDVLNPAYSRLRFRTTKIYGYSPKETACYICSNIMNILMDPKDLQECEEKDALFRATSFDDSTENPHYYRLTDPELISDMAARKPG